MTSNPGAALDLSAVVWRKSTFSGPDNECVEVAYGLPDLMPVRDSKNPAGPALVFPAAAWSAFVAGVKAGDFPVGS
ncbi:DUF397 domain-containing protein [Kitasatospora indigofera]|uniref:DUF397 domain-containing protein n=1 Tax=Kitasatospora indigofera TaxID=67307 RepID=UPI0033AF1028